MCKDQLQDCPIDLLTLQITLVSMYHGCVFSVDIPEDDCSLVNILPQYPPEVLYDALELLCQKRRVLFIGTKRSYNQYIVPSTFFSPDLLQQLEDVLNSNTERGRVALPRFMGIIKKQAPEVHEMLMQFSRPAQWKLIRWAITYECMGGGGVSDYIAKRQYNYNYIYRREFPDDTK